MNILITGSSGFVGKKLMEVLLEEGHSIRCLLRKTSNLCLTGKNIEILKGNLLNESFLEKSMSGIEMVFHLAALRGEKYLPYEEYEKTNIELTEKLLRVSRNAEKFIFCSTVGVIGFGTGLDEKSDLKPKGNYHLSKAKAEKLCLEYKNSIIIRPSIVYGAGDRDGFLHKLIKLIAKKKFLLIGNAKNRIHMVHIDNLVQGLIQIGRKGNFGESYIIADKTSLSVKEIAGIIAKKLEIPPPVLKIPRVLAIVASCGYEGIYSLLSMGKEPFISRSRVDIISLEQDFNTSKARNIGYEPKIDTKTGIEGQIEWMKKEKML